MPNTYTLIEKITVGAAGASSITFTSIPQTYTDLCIVASARASNTNVTYNQHYLTFNSSTTSFSGRRLWGSSAGAASFTTTRNAGLFSSDSSTSNTFGSTQIYIPNYTGSTNKSFSVETTQENNSATDFYVEMIAGLWSDTSAITSITLTPEIAGSSYKQYSTFYLYGIAKEGVSPSPSSAPYATGGDSIVFDGTYWIHTFTSSGTFTPKKGLTCDYLVVAGGGGGGTRGGGGAGGFRTATSQLLTTTTAYSVTVGGGGAIDANGSDSVFNSMTSTGGGKGATNTNAGNGGSGGGGYDDSVTNFTAGTGNTPSTSPSQGNNGGAGGGASRYTGGGGGGAGAVGSAGGSGGNPQPGGAGGAGTASSISGSSVTYAGGGGGGGDTGGAGGAGGGGKGADSATDTAVAGTANTGGGGGGGRSGAGVAKAGGSGIVIVRYAA